MFKHFLKSVTEIAFKDKVSSRRWPSSRNEHNKGLTRNMITIKRLLSQRNPQRHPFVRIWKCNQQLRKHFLMWWGKNTRDVSGPRSAGRTSRNFYLHIIPTTATVVTWSIQGNFGCCGVICSFSYQLLTPDEQLSFPLRHLFVSRSARRPFFIFSEFLTLPKKWNLWYTNRHYSYFMGLNVEKV